MYIALQLFKISIKLIFAWLRGISDLESKLCISKFCCTDDLFVDRDSVPTICFWICKKNCPISRPSVSCVIELEELLPVQDELWHQEGTLVSTWIMGGLQLNLADQKCAGTSFLSPGKMSMSQGRIKSSLFIVFIVFSLLKKFSLNSSVAHTYFSSPDIFTYIRPPPPHRPCVPSASVTAPHRRGGPTVQIWLPS